MAVISNHKAAGRLRVLRLLRAERGFELFDRGRIRFRPSRGEPLFFIRSESRPDLVHYVDPDPSAPFGYVCGCEDYAKLGRVVGFCKHVAAVLMWGRKFPCFECGRPQHRPVCFECERRVGAENAQVPDLDAWFFGEPGR